MSKSLSGCKDNLRSKFRYFTNATSRLIASANTALFAGMVALSPTLCNGVGTNATDHMSGLFLQMVTIICQIAFWVGAIIVVGGIFSWLLAQKDENADAQSRAIKFIVVGMALCSLRFLVNPLISALGISGG